MFTCPQCCKIFINIFEFKKHINNETCINTQIEEKVLLPSLLEEFDSTIKTITTERGKIYGHPKEDFERVQTMIRVVETCSHPGIKHVLTMLCVKIARLVISPDHLDSWIDIAGYARTAVMILDKEK